MVLKRSNGTRKSDRVVSRSEVGFEQENVTTNFLSTSNISSRYSSVILFFFAFQLQLKLPNYINFNVVSRVLKTASISPYFQILFKKTFLKIGSNIISIETWVLLPVPKISFFQISQREIGKRLYLILVLYFLSKYRFFKYCTVKVLLFDNKPTRIHFNVVKISLNDRYFLGLF